MLVARCYTVLDRLVCEVSCVHLGAGEESHIVLREEHEAGSGTLQEGLRALGETAEIAAWDLARRRGLGEPAPGSSCCP